MLIILIFFFTGLLFLNYAEQDTQHILIDTNKAEKIMVSEDVTETAATYYSEPLVLAVSLIPGGTQFLTKNYIKAGFFLGSEVTIFFFSSFRHWLYQQSREDLRKWTDSVKAYDTVSIVTTDTSKSRELYSLKLKYSMQLKLSTADSRQARLSFYHSLAWLLGVYAYNFMDALDIIEFAGSKESQTKNPSTAGWLSAIPFLGLGQLYNEAYSKAGLIWMTQTALGFMVYNYNSLMKEAKEQYIAITDSTQKEYYLANAISPLTRTSFKNSWQARHDEAFRNRNMYLWYWLLFYFYGIFDAVVDAHLYDLPIKMKLEPDLIPQEATLNIDLTLNF